jgi:S1-C subfamily serine protease
VLTAAHVTKKLGAVKTVKFPDGTEYRGVTTAIDHTLDLAIVTLEGASDLPSAPIAAAAPDVGTLVVAIGQPGRWTPDGDATGYQPWHVSVGEIRRFADDRLADQGLGGTAHDAWTYWGHSGCPLFDASGQIVALHNSWDSTTAMRHAVTWEAIVYFLSEAGVEPVSAR